MIDYIVVSLGELLKDEGISIEKLNNIFKKFSCSKEKDLEDFLVKSAIQYEQIEYGKTFLILDKQKMVNGELNVAAFFTIGQVSLDISVLSQKRKRKIVGNFPGRDNINSLPAYLIGQLGRSDEYSKTMMPGKLILDECYSRIRAAQVIVGGKIMILECREALQEFYKSQDFKQLNDKNEQGLYTYYKKI